MRTLKEVAQTLFVLFYRLGRGAWPAQFNADAHKGAAGITFVKALFAPSLFDWYQIYTAGQLRPAHWLMGAAAALIYALNYYYWVSLGTGTAFERKFDTLSKRRKIVLYAAAVLIAIVSGVLFFFSVNVYRQTFHLGRHDTSNWLPISLVTRQPLTFLLLQSPRTHRDAVECIPLSQRLGRSVCAGDRRLFLAWITGSLASRA